MALAPVLTQPSTTATVSATQPQSTAPATNPFTRATRKIQKFVDKRVYTFTSATQSFQDAVQIPASGYLGDLTMLVQAVGSAGNTTTVAITGDAPWNLFSNFSLNDTVGRPLYGPYTGYDMFITNLLGGYDYISDPRLKPSYNAVATGLDASGSFQYALKIPVELSRRDAFCALPNSNAKSTYTLNYTLNPLTTLFSTAPVVSVASPFTVTITFMAGAYPIPLPTDAMGVPNSQTPNSVTAAGASTQYWRKQIYNLAAGYQEIQFTDVGNVFRSVVFILRDNNGNRIANATSVFPENDAKLMLNDQPLGDLYPFSLFLDKAVSDTGLTGTMLDTPGAMPNGVFLLSQFDDQLQRYDSDGLRDFFLPTLDTSKMQLIGTWGAVVAGSTMSILTNTLLPSAGTPLYS